MGKVFEVSWDECMKIYELRMNTNMTFREITETTVSCDVDENFTEMTYYEISNILNDNKKLSFNDLKSFGKLFGEIRGRKILIIIKRLWRAGIYTPEQLYSLSKQEVESIPGIGVNYTKIIMDLIDKNHKS